MNHPVSKLRWLLLIAALPTAGCLLVQPLDSATPDEDDSSAAGSSSSHAGAKGSAGKSSGSSGATGSAGRGAAGAGGGVLTGKALFIGTWTITTGSTTIDCTGTPQTQPLTGSDIWAAGTSSDLVLDPSTTCPLKANVTGRTAIGEPGFTCTTSGTDSSTGAAYTTLLEADAYSFIIASDGKTASATLTGTATYTSGGTSVPCDFSEQAEYSKN